MRTALGILQRALIITTDALPLKPRKRIVSTGTGNAAEDRGTVLGCWEAAVRVIKIDQDMDHAGMSDMKELFNELTRSSEDVCLDLSQVRFLDSAGIDGLVLVRRALSSRLLKFGIIHAKGQPQHLLHQVLLDSFVGSERVGRAYPDRRAGALSIGRKRSFTPALAA
jgi:anti-anti-sigma regulatory factor